MKNIFKKEETEFLIENYPKLGCRECAKILNKTDNQIKHKICILKRKNIHLTLLSSVKDNIMKNRSWKEKQFHEYNVNPSRFINTMTPESVYVLGILWADGYIRIKPPVYRINLSILKSDFKDIKRTFLNTGKWAIQKFKQKGRREQNHCNTNNKSLATFLMTNDYVSKSSYSADKILSHIPDELKKYWFRGLIDGDGYLCIQKKSYKLEVSSSYKQEWNYLENIFKKFGIKYSITRRISKKKNKKIHKSSYIGIYNRTGIIQFGNYIWEGFENDSIGFKRKYKIFKKIIRSNCHLRSLNV